MNRDIRILRRVLQVHPRSGELHKSKTMPWRKNGRNTQTSTAIANPLAKQPWPFIQARTRSVATVATLLVPARVKLAVTIHEKYENQMRNNRNCNGAEIKEHGTRQSHRTRCNVFLGFIRLDNRSPRQTTTIGQTTFCADTRAKQAVGLLRK